MFGEIVTIKSAAADLSAERIRTETHYRLTTPVEVVLSSLVGSGAAFVIQGIHETYWDWNASTDPGEQDYPPEYVYAMMGYEMFKNGSLKGTFKELYMSDKNQDVILDLAGIVRKEVDND